MLAFLLVLASIAGPVPVLKLYGMPYIVCIHEKMFFGDIFFHDG